VTELRRTKRRYAHELYPHPKDGEVRPLEVDVPYLYARAIGLDVGGTGWFSQEARPIAIYRTAEVVAARQQALVADALLQGLVGQDAWQWAMERADDEGGEHVWERATHYGVDTWAIKPYPCGPEPTQHTHWGPPDRHGFRVATPAPGPEAQCEDCTEPVPAGG
jgi:hypothetical protein